MRVAIATAIVAATVAALGATSCGDDGERVDQPAATVRLSAEERGRISSYERRIATHCVRVAQSLADQSAAPSPRQEAAAFGAVDKLLALAAEKPTAPYGPGQDLRLFVSDVVENLEGSNCDPRLLGRLQSGLAQIPVS